MPLSLCLSVPLPLGGDAESDGADEADEDDEALGMELVAGMASAIDEDEIVNDQTLGADLQFGEMMHKARFNKALKVVSSKHMETILEDVDQEEEAEDAVIIASLGAGHDPGESGGQADKGPPDCGPPRSHPSHCDLPDPPPDPPDPPGHLAAPAGEISMPPLGQTWWREFQSNLCALKLRFDHIARCDQVGGQDGANLTLLQHKATLDVVLVNWKDSKQLQCQTANVDYRHRQIFSMPMVNKWFDFHEPSWDLSSRHWPAQFEVEGQREITIARSNLSHQNGV